MAYTVEQEPAEPTPHKQVVQAQRIPALEAAPQGLPPRSPGLRLEAQVVFLESCLLLRRHHVLIRSERAAQEAQAARAAEMAVLEQRGAFES